MKLRDIHESNLLQNALLLMFIWREIDVIFFTLTLTLEFYLFVQQTTWSGCRSNKSSSEWVNEFKHAEIAL
jgi:hypothetical protein